MHKRLELFVKVAGHAQNAAARSSPEAGRQSGTLGGLSCECASTRMYTCAAVSTPTPSHLPPTAQRQKRGQIQCMRHHI